MSKKNLDTDSLLHGIGDSSVGAVTPKKPKLSQLPAQKIMDGTKKSKTPEPKKTRVMVLEIDPRHCVRWKYADRFEDWFTYENSKNIIDTMYEKGQEIPGVVRKIKEPKGDVQYEVILAGRRHFSATYCTEELNKFTPFKAILKDIDDVEAARLQDMENRVKDDISEFERCVSFRKKLGYIKGFDAIYNSINELIKSWHSEEEAELQESKGEDQEHDKVAKTKKKKLTKAAVSQMAQAGELNEIKELISLFGNRRIEIPWSMAYRVMLEWKRDSKSQKALKKRAQELKDSADSMGAVSILKTLLESVKPKKAPVPPRYQEKLKLDGKVAVKAVANEKELTLKLPLETIKNASREQLVELIGSAMSKATA